MGATAVPDALLCKLTPGAETAAGKVRGLAAALPALEADGLVSSRKDGRVVLVRLTEAGQARATAVVEAEAAAKAAARAAKAAARPARAAKATGRPATAAQRLAALEATVASLTERVAALEGARRGGDGATAAAATVATTAPPPAAPAPPPAVPDEAIVRDAVLAAIGALDARHRFGGLVPIPDVRAELRRGGLGADDAAVDAALEALERAWKIDLSVAQSPTLVADRAAGIERPGRGLLYYVARR
ncbi:MAG: hypothetical protein KJZ91_18970 [Myxococcales bacterium]|nr:hypothetical protein [Myxococcales bacterium]